MQADKDNIEISIIIPVYNEEKNIPVVFDRLKATLDELNSSYEIIFIDDGSTDDTLGILEDLHENDDRVAVYSLRKNQGKAAALTVGFRRARGRVIATMDGDGQDEPSELPRMIEKLNEGYDLINGWKYPRQDPLSKRLPSKLYNSITSLLAGITLHDMNSGLKVYRREVVQSIPIYGELHRFIVFMAHRENFKVTEIKVKHNPRLHGKTKYGSWRYFAGFLDLITSMFLSRFSRRPMHFFGFSGFLLLLAGTIINAYLAIGWFFGRWIGNRPLLFLGILLMLLGIQLISTGLLGEMLSRWMDKEYNYPLKRELPAGVRSAEGGK